MGTIIIGVIFIIGGLTGSMTLRGTGSAIGLAVVGAVLCLWGVIEMANAKPKVKTVRRSTRTTKSGTARTTASGTARLRGRPGTASQSRRQR